MLECIGIILALAIMDKIAGIHKKNSDLDEEILNELKIIK